MFIIFNKISNVTKNYHFSIENILKNKISLLNNKYKLFIAVTTVIFWYVRNQNIAWNLL